ncbi:NAD-dependent dehydratase [Streptococcus suis]|uniref:NAD-dependent dehydratase n=1 Tax=Streptococcus suis TaxID=1307 RepID=UPI0019219221|nr:NAD-dependent dehydratase [Streptococcus suis]MBL1124960.1 NAD-dependent dehydratase [Streptococcus suis]
MSNNTAILLGATGEVGGHLLQELVTNPHYRKIYVLGRASINKLPNYQKIEKIIINFNKPIVNQSILIGADVFCAIGTGERQDFEKVDYGHAYGFAKLCAGKVKSFNLVSAMGANSQTSYKYLQVKGRLEQDLLALDLGNQRFYRPSMLIAPQRKNLDWSEAVWIKIFQVISPALVGPMAGWKGMKTADLARSMVTNALSENPQTVYLHADMMATRS